LLQVWSAHPIVPATAKADTAPRLTSTLRESRVARALSPRSRRSGGTAGVGATWCSSGSSVMTDAFDRGSVATLPLACRKARLDRGNSYTDRAISGASPLRPGIQELICDAMRGKFVIVLAEAMDRLSRDQDSGIRRGRPAAFIAIAWGRAVRAIVFVSGADFRALDASMKKPVKSLT
jgi:hypothetical protein